jgi:hypothetical protein
MSNKKYHGLQSLVLNKEMLASKIEELKIEMLENEKKIEDILKV